MASNTSLSLLLTGATGYIGGSVLNHILHSTYKKVKNLKISVLIRNASQAEVFDKQGLRTILFESLDQQDILQKAAKEHDVVIHTASGFHTASAQALIRGLGERKKDTGRDVYYIHTSGTSNLGDRPISKQYSESRIFSDKEDIYEYELHRESIEIYAQRTTDIAVVKTGIDHSVKTYIIMSPTIYGKGSGYFNNISLQSPGVIRDMIKHGNVAVIGEGKGIWNHVHIEDLVFLYEIILNKVISGEAIPEGKKGIYFAETGEHSWWEFADIIAKEGKKEGVSKQEEPLKVTLEEGAKRFAGGDSLVAELGFASNSRTRADLSRELGWNPQKTNDDFKKYLQEEVKYIINAK